MKKPISRLFSKLAAFYKKHPALDLIIILLIGLHVFIGLKPGLLYIGGDTGIPLNPLKNLSLFYLWENREAGGVLLSLGVAFQLIFFAFLELIGLSLSAIQKSYIYFSHTLAGLSMYYLATSFSLGRKRAIGLIASIFYMFSPWFINYVGTFVLLPCSVMPLLLALFIRGISGKMSMLKSTLFIALSLFGVIVNLPQYSMYFVMLLLMGLYTLFHLFVSKGDLKYSFKYVFFLFFGVFLASLWLFLPYFSIFSQTGINTELEAAVSVAGYLHDFGDFGYSTILNLLRIFGAAGFMAGGATYSQPYMENPALIIISFVFPLLAFSAILLKPKSKSVLFFSGVAMIFIFLAKGVNAPLGKLHFWLVSFFPLARALRTTWNLSLGANLAYAFLIGAAVVGIAERLGRKKPRYFTWTILLAVALIIINGWPLITGDYFEYKWNPPSFDGVEIPQGYWDLRDYLTKETTDSRFLRVPIINWYLITDWGYFGSNFFYSMFSSPFISGYPKAKEARGLIEDVYYRLENQYRPRENIFKALSLLNVKRLVYDGYDEEPKPDVRDKLSSDSGVNFEKKIGQFDVYQLDEDYYLPHFYVPERLIYTNTDLSNFAEIIDFPEYNLRTGLLSIDLGEKRAVIGEGRDEIIVKAAPVVSLRDESEKGRVMGNLDYNAVYFPYARWRPNNPLYPLVLKKEELELKNSRLNPKEYIDKQVFFASKRISEIKKWGESLTADEWEKVENHYDRLMRGAIDEVKRVSQQGDYNAFISLLFKTRNAFYTHVNQIDTNFFRNKDSRYFKEEAPIDKTFKKLRKDLEALERPPDLFSITYQFNLPKEGQYALLIEDKSDYFQEVFFKSSQLKIDGREISLKDFEVENKTIKTRVGLDLEKGEHQLELLFRNVEDLLPSDSWQRQPPLYEAKDDSLFFHSSGPFSPQEWTSVPQEIENYSPNSYFLVSFDYLVKNGSAGFSIVQRGEIDPKTGKPKPLLISRMPISKENEPQHYEGLFRSTGYKDASIYLLAQQYQTKASNIQYKNIQIKPVFTPSITFESESSQTTNLSEIPKITFKRVNPTKYKILVEEAKDPYLLVFSEGIDGGWKAYVRESQGAYGEIIASYFDGAIKEGAHKNIFLDKNTLETWGREPLPEERHFLVNGYANGWLIKPEDAGGKETYEVIIEFFPQKMFYLGLGMSLLSVIIGLGILLRKRIFKS